MQCDRKETQTVKESDIERWMECKMDKLQEREQTKNEREKKIMVREKVKENKHM